MPQPPEYERQFDFSGFSDSTPNAQQPGAQLDAEYDAIKTTIDAIRSRLVLLQRDDGRIVNKGVGIDQLDDIARALMASNGLKYRGNFTSGDEYKSGEIVYDSGNFYIVLGQFIASTVSAAQTAGRLSQAILTEAAPGDSGGGEGAGLTADAVAGLPPVAGIAGNESLIVLQGGVLHKATADEVSRFTADAILALPEQLHDATKDPTIAIEVDGILKWTKLSFFASRLTADLQDFTALLGNELAQVYSPTALADGKVSLGVLQRRLTGVINPKLPPYNCKGDCQDVQDAVTSIGYNIVTSASGQFSNGDVGKEIYISNAGPGGSVLSSTITQYDSPTQIRIATNASVSRSNEMMWGTNDSAGMAAALYAARGLGPYTFGGVVALPPGGYLCDPQLMYSNMGFFSSGGRQGYLVRRPTPGNTNAALRLSSQYNEMIAVVNVGIFGARYFQPNASDNFQFSFVGGGGTTPSVDPSPYFHGLHSWYASQDCFYHGGRGAGHISDLFCKNAQRHGVRGNGYDMHWTGIWSEGNNNNAILFDASSSGYTLTNAKGAYSGVVGGSHENGATIHLNGSAHIVTAVRGQEPWGDAFCITGSDMKLANCAAEDVNDVYAGNHQGNSSPLSVSAGFYLNGPTCQRNFFSDSHVDIPIKLSTCYATHGIFLTGNAAKNRGDIWINQRITSWYANGVSGAPTPGPYGTNSSGGWGATNNPLRIDGIQGS